MYGYQAKETLDKTGIAYLPLGCLELHGSHLPMGLDVIKAHGLCCLMAQHIGGVVFPAHYYSGIHMHNPEQQKRCTGMWGNLYTDATARASIIDIVTQIQYMGAKVCVLHSGHYPGVQSEMVESVAAHFAGSSCKVIVCPEKKLCNGGDHAGICETSLLLYLNRNLVNMAAICEQGYTDHDWAGAADPKLASAAKGEELAGIIVSYMKNEINRILTLEG